MEPGHRQMLFKRLQAEARLLSHPLDLEDLIARKILTKQGLWYRVPNIEQLPKNATALIREIARDSRGTKVKFEKVSKAQLRRLEKLQRLPCP